MKNESQKVLDTPKIRNVQRKPKNKRLKNGEKEIQKKKNEEKRMER